MSYETGRDDERQRASRHPSPAFARSPPSRSGARPAGSLNRLKFSSSVLKSLQLKALKNPLPKPKNFLRAQVLLNRS